MSSITDAFTQPGTNRGLYYNGAFQKPETDAVSASPTRPLLKVSQPFQMQRPLTLTPQSPLRAQLSQVGLLLIP